MSLLLTVIATSAVVLTIALTAMYFLNKSVNQSGL